jgi:hypothetical protein
MLSLTATISLTPTLCGSRRPLSTDAFGCYGWNFLDLNRRRCFVEHYFRLLDRLRKAGGKAGVCLNGWSARPRCDVSGAGAHGDPSPDEKPNRSLADIHLPETPHTQVEQGLCL